MYMKSLTIVILFFTYVSQSSAQENRGIILDTLMELFGGDDADESNPLEAAISNVVDGVDGSSSLESAILNADGDLADKGGSNSVESTISAVDDGGAFNGGSDPVESAEDF